MFPLHSLDGFFSSSYWGWGWGDWGGGGGGGGQDGRISIDCLATQQTMLMARIMDSSISDGGLTLT